MSLSIEKFLSLRESHPLIDVRSESEFAAGHIRSAVNIPILNNEERVIVGTAYKKQGSKKAISEGFRLVGPRLSDIIETTSLASRGKEILVHCWRGGMRSGNFCQFAAMAGMKSYSLNGGYKAYRSFALESFSQPLKIVLLAGFTGSGKSEILRELKNQGEQVLDLEALASHKGSAFGGLMMNPQPTTEQFQNELFEEIFKLDTSRRVWVEDESLAIGRIFLPNHFWAQMSVAPLIQMNVQKSSRVQRLVDEYGAIDRNDFLAVMSKIVKRLGGQNFKAAKEKLDQGHMHEVMEILLTYYDKTYLEGINRRSDRIGEVITWDGNDSATFAKMLIEISNNKNVKV